MVLIGEGREEGRETKGGMDGFIFFKKTNPCVCSASPGGACVHNHEAADRWERIKMARWWEVVAEKPLL